MLAWSGTAIDKDNGPTKWTGTMASPMNRGHDEIGTGPFALVDEFGVDERRYCSLLFLNGEE